jgi:hypothetical protein
MTTDPTDTAGASGDRREALRQVFLDAWAKSRSGAPLDAMESRLVAVIERHPEHHALLGDRERALHEEYPAQPGVVNPFLHLALHVELLEQVTLDRPPGIRAIHQSLVARHGLHEADHRLGECLARVLRDALAAGGQPDPADYLRAAGRLAGTP